MEMISLYRITCCCELTNRHRSVFSSQAKCVTDETFSSSSKGAICQNGVECWTNKIARFLFLRAAHTLRRGVIKSLITLVLDASVRETTSSCCTLTKKSGPSSLALKWQRERESGWMDGWHLTSLSLIPYVKQKSNTDLFISLIFGLRVRESAPLSGCGGEKIPLASCS